MSERKYYVNESVASDICQDLGQIFIQLYDNIYNKSTSNVNDDILRMNTLQQIVADIYIEEYGTKLHLSELHDWFYTAGAVATDYMKNPTRQEAIDYASFIIRVMSGQSIKQSLESK